MRKRGQGRLSGRGEGWARPSGRPVPDVFLSFRISLQGQEGQEPASWIWVEWAKFGLQSYKRAGSECSPTLRGVAGAGGGVHRGRGPQREGTRVGPQGGRAPFPLLSSSARPPRPPCCPGTRAPCSRLRGSHWLPSAWNTSSHPTSTQRLPPCLEAIFKCFSPRPLPIYGNSNPYLNPPHPNLCFLFPRALYLSHTI